MTTSKPLYALQLPTDATDFGKNLSRLCDAIDNCPDGAIVVTPEVCLTGYPYDRMDEAAAIADEALVEVMKRSKGKVVTLTTIVKEEGDYYNRTFVLHDGAIVHEQDKIRLFLLGDEDKYFTPGKEEKMKIVEVDGMRLGLMVCFELRYTEFWLKLRGADLILVPARWGLPRKGHLEITSTALAVCNQCYVAVANSADDDMAKSSAVIDPNGERVADDNAVVIQGEFDPRRIKLIRRYIRMGVFE
ncbi:carbon-nitrogen hydrolase family protein [Hydrogenimonas sp.]